jgi:hypothetical protein
MTHTPAAPSSSRCARLIALGVGFAATVWFLMRVLQKPSRASYPCMRVSFPIMSTFVTYLLSLVGAAASVRLLRRDRFVWRPRSLVLASLVATLFWTTAFVPRCAKSGDSDSTPGPGTNEAPTTVLGRGVGLSPGRVVWIHDRDATNENCTNLPGDGYFLSANNDQSVVDRMLTEGMVRLTGASNASDACERLFIHFNQTHGRGSAGYTPGERVFIKTNATSSWGFGESWGNINQDFTIVANGYYGTAETSPAAVLAMLRLLVGECGVPEPDITVGDPMKDIYAHALEQWRPEFPAVTYQSAHGGRGRTASTPSVQPLIFYSDRGSVLRTGTSDDPSAGAPVEADHLYSIYEQASYVVNLAAFKGHARGGVTMCAKNHFGSNTRGGADHLHMGLVNPAGGEPVRPDRRGYGLYRVLVDLMGHRLLGGKTVLYVVDGLWGGPEAVDPPARFTSEPFGNDWSSSLLLSQDPVAIESVGFDILKEEMTTDRHPGKAFPQMSGVDDYLHQAADPAQWPSGIRYDPENDGTALDSLGVHEHWVSASDRRYGRNLGHSEGIELVYVAH